MNIKISRGALRGTVQMISSKSDAHRLFIGAALADRPTEMVLNGSSEDLEATLQCLQALGADFLRQGDKIKVFPVEKKEELTVMDCRESGSTLRFLLPVAAALGRNVLVEGPAALRNVWTAQRRYLFSAGQCKLSVYHGIAFCIAFVRRR